MTRLAIVLRDGSTALTVDQPGAPPETLLEHFTKRGGVFAAEWIEVEPGQRYVRYDLIAQVHVAPGGS